MELFAYSVGYKIVDTAISVVDELLDIVFSEFVV
jgi:hypothetical protein